MTAAFDRVDAELLLQKLNHGGIHPRMHRVLESWLGTRKANVIVGGEMSINILMKDMIFQGAMLGPLSWNIFFSDVGRILSADGFLDVTFADDLNGMRCYPTS